MTADAKTPDGLSLRRWSRRKLEAARARDGAGDGAESATPVIPVAPPAPVAAAEQPPAPAPAATLPPIESLTIDSDFAAFFQPKVDETLKRQALKQLLRDPRFNLMDGLDVYIDDYSRPDPISPDIVRQMVQGRYIFDPPQTRINAQGQVEDVPPEKVVLDRPEGPAEEPAEAPLVPAVAEATGTAPAPPAPGESAVEPSAPTDPETAEPSAR